MKTTVGPPKTLIDLPVELVAELYLFALSPAFPQTCKYIHVAIKSLPSSVHARYIMYRHPSKRWWWLSPPPLVPIVAESIPANHHGQAISGKPVLEISPLTRALRYPLCTISVLEAIHRICLRARNSSLPINIGDSRQQLEHTAFELPKRLFRSLGQEPPDGGILPLLDADAEPLPLLRLLWEWHTMDTELCHSAAKQGKARRYAVNSHGGYPLVRAVHAQFVPLMQFLLDHGADPRLREGMAVKVAIGKKDLRLVKMLIEFGEESGPGAKVGKKRRRLDRVEVTPSMLELAVRCDARDIVQYFVEEKGCIPNMKTLKAVRHFPAS